MWDMKKQVSKKPKLSGTRTGSVVAAYHPNGLPVFRSRTASPHFSDEQLQRAIENAAIGWTPKPLPARPFRKSK
jgi:hypothetical protein